MGFSSTVLDANQIRNKNLSHRTVLGTYIIELKLTALEEAYDTLQREAEKLTSDHRHQFAVDDYFNELQNKVESLETELMDFLSQNREDIHQESLMQLLQAHGRLNLMAPKLAKEFELFDSSLIVLSINRGDYEKVIDLICLTKDEDIRCRLMIRYAQVLLKQKPKLMLQRMRIGFEKVKKMQLIPAFNAMDEKHSNLTCAANYVKEFWIDKLGETEKTFYNLVF